MKTAFRVVALALLVISFGACATQDQQNQNQNQSSIPWNRPQSWEGQGMLGGYMNQEGSTGRPY